MPMKTHLDEDPKLNLTPMIDIVFLLIIFFMVGTTFSQMERNIELHVPEVTDGGALTAPPEKRVVNVFQDGRIALDQQFVSLDGLTSELVSARDQYSDLGVIVRGDGRGAFQNVAEVLNACKNAGIGELDISVKLATPKGN